jgi:hypothetical protein
MGVREGMGINTTAAFYHLLVIEGNQESITFSED